MEQLPLLDADVVILRQGVTETILVPVIDRLKPGVVLSPESGTLTLLNNRDQAVLTSAFLAEGNADVVRVREGVYSLTLDTNVYNQAPYLAAWTFVVAGELRTVQKNTCINVLTSRWYRLFPILRGQIDKAAKDIAAELEYGWTDARLAVHLEQGATLISAVSPFTPVSVDTFPLSFSKLLIDGACISALESQGAFSIDTDHSFSLGGHSLVIDHWSSISSYLSYMVQNFNERVKHFKQYYRPKGTAVIQLQASYSYGRWLASVPGEWYSRFLVGGGPGAVGTGVGFVP